MSSYRKPSEYSAKRTLERFFANKNTTFITRDEMIASWHRDKPEYKSRNDKWLYNKLTPIYSYSLARPIYTHDPYRRLESIELTDKGKSALSRDGSRLVSSIESLSSSTKSPTLSIEDIIEAANTINKRLTAYKIKVSLEEKDR